MLYTASILILDKVKEKIKSYYLIPNRGNDSVLPDKLDLEQYRNKALTWEGFKVSYLAKLMKTEAEEWMKHVSLEATICNVVLVSDEESEKRLYRVLLAEMMMNMFSGHMSLRYEGELKGSESF